MSDFSRTSADGGEPPAGDGVRLKSDTGMRAWLEPGTVGEVLRLAAAHLERHGSGTARLDAELCVAHVLRLSRSELALQRGRELERRELDELSALVGRRATGEPLQYVLGEWGFRRLTLTVDARALIPRPETEVVVERCLELVERLQAPRVLDVGTGTGAIALAVADEHPGARVTGIDVSVDALALARENVERTGLDVELAAHDLFAGLPAGPWDLVVSNPPYVDPADRASLQPEVREWEPPVALYGSDATAAVARGAVDVLSAVGALVLEVGDGHASATVKLLRSLGYTDVRSTADLAGRDRVVEGRR